MCQAGRRESTKARKLEGPEPWGAVDSCCGWKTEWWRSVWSQAEPEDGDSIPLEGEGRALTCWLRVLALTQQLWGDGLNDSVTLSAEHMLCKV